MKTADPREETLFREALQRAMGPERRAFLDGTCRRDDVLRARLEALLQAHESQEPFLEPQATPPATTTVLLPPEEAPGTLIGRYKILEKIGEGGFGVVYVAEQREPVKRRVALKIIKLGMDTRQVVARFEAERQALALMDHPNIAKVLDAGTTDAGRPYFVMELVKGIPITKYWEQEKTETTERLNLFIQVCHAIQHAHQKGIIHRDIKPSNILVTLHDGVPVPKVIDFGIAKATQQELTEKTVYTQFQQFIGTPAYMSPEQAEMSGLDIDTRSDIYSLGVLLYELLTGSTPFDTKELLQSGLDEMRKIIRERQPVRPSTRVTQRMHQAGDPKIENRQSKIENDLDWIVLKCLEKDRTRRYETANGVAQDIERHLKHELVVARPPSLGYRLQKSFRRNSLVFTAAGLVGLALVLGALLSTWQAVRATRESRRADQAAQVADSQRVRAQEEAQKAKASDLEARRSLYAADMSLACRAWQENSLGIVLGLLDKHRPAAAQPDLRGWEWRYLWRACQSEELYNLASLPYGVAGVAISPNARLLATAGTYFTGRGGVTLWDIASRKLIATPDAEDGSGSVAFSPDGKTLASGSADYTIKLWNTATWDEVSTLRGGRHEIWSLAYSPDGRLLFSGAKDGTVKAWASAPRPRDLTVLARPADASGFYVDRDTGTTVAWHTNKTLTLWEPGTLRKLGPYAIPAAEVLTNAAWTVVLPGSDRLALANRQGAVVIWDLPGARIVKTLSWIRREVASTPEAVGGMSPDRTLLGFVAADRLTVWNLQTLEETAALTRSAAAPARLGFARDNDSVAVANDDGTIEVCRLASRERVGPWKAHQEEITGLAFMPGGKLLLSSSTDASLKLWDVASQQELPRFSRCENAYDSLAITPDGLRVAAGSWNKHIRIWNAATGQEVATLKGFHGEVTYLGFFCEGGVLVSGTYNEVRLWRAPPWEEIAATERKQGEEARTQ